MTDNLSAPLGQDRLRKRRTKLPFTLLQALAVLFGLFLLTFFGFVIFNDNPMGGEPTARIAYDPSVLPGEKTAKPAAGAMTPKQPPVAVPAAPTADASAPQKTITIIDGSSGVRREVPIGTGADGPNKADADVPTMMAGIDQKLLETSRYGMIPIIADGVKPFRAYAGGSEAERARAATTPSIAIVIAGLGVGAAKTSDAIVKLPSVVTLAFTPYGSDPGKLVERARASKHEILLQVPMEPFDYPDNDPGPQTLLTTLAPEQNIDRLTWHMSRFQGYVGLANFMGSKAVVTDSVMQPIMKEAAKRGLGYLDDGSSARSVAGFNAEAKGVPFAASDLTIDSVPTAGEIDKSLGKLESIARERGTAVGMASALPISIDRISAWTKQLASHGVMLVPLTTAILKSKSK